jgi:hypothetical protein
MARADPGTAFELSLVVTTTTPWHLLQDKTVSSDGCEEV